MRRPPVVLGLAGLTGAALLVALALILFSVNPGVGRNEREIKTAVMSQHAIICAQVQNTANAYRFRSLTPSGEVEPIRHFLTRMQAQQQTLRLARGSECRSAPGFPPVGLQVRRALNQIKRILENFGPRMKEPVSRGLHVPRGDVTLNKHNGFSSGLSGFSKGGVDESGVPATLKPHVAPSAPIAPQTGRKHSPPPPEEPEHAEEVPEPVEPQSSGGPGTNVAIEPKRPELPTVPIPAVEVKLEVPLEGTP